MIHLGDITQLHGDEIPVVDIITGGSPCQDLSVAGKRAGLDGERSGLFMEQIRIVKEMRERDRRTGRTAWLIRPRFMVWENVPGAFSSNGGRDFQAVLSEIVKIAEPDAPDVPLPDKGKWPKAGCLYSDLGKWSVAWRVHDAQFCGTTEEVDGRVLNLGTPQRRKRIALVADFGGLAAPEVLFEREGLSGDSEPSGAEREGTSTSTAVGSGSASGTSGLEPVPIEGNGQRDSHRGNGYGNEGDPMFTLNSTEHHAVVAEAYGICSYDSNAMKSPNPNSGFYKADTSRTLDLNGGSPACNHGGVAVVEAVSAGFSFGQSAKARSLGYQEEVSPTLRGGEGGNQKPCVLDATAISGDISGTLDASYYKVCGERQGVEREVVCIGNGQLNQMSMAEQANTMDTMHDQQAVMVLPFDTTQVTSDKNWSNPHYGDPCHPLSAQAHVPSIASPSVVRRLTPLECERLQGFPDGWTDIGEWTDTKGKKHKEADSPRYKALGNSIALPFWQWMARRICAQYERTPTMGSLFDGIGGFPLVFQRSGAVPVWASEIEEFPIAVTKYHFKEE